MDQDENNTNPPNQQRNFRTDEKLTQSDVAFLLDIKNAGRISEWENGLSNPGLEHLITLELIYHRLADDMYFALKQKLLAKLNVRKKLLLEIKDKRRKNQKDKRNDERSKLL